MDFLDFLIDPWRSGIDRRALLEVALLGSACGGLSYWVTTFRLSYAAESLAHGMLPGLVLAALAGAPLLLGGAGGVAVAAALIALASRDERIGADTATAVVVTGAFGLGALLALAPETPARLGELLFGDPLGVSDGDLLAAAALAAGGAAALFALHRPLVAVAFDEAGAAGLGVRPGLVRLGLALFLAVALAVAVQGLGSLLVLAVLVAPAVAVRRHARTPAQAVVLGGGLAVLAGFAGITASQQFGSAAGASVALALCGLALVGSVVRAGAGVGGLRRAFARDRRTAAG